MLNQDNDACGLEKSLTMKTKTTFIQGPAFRRVLADTPWRLNKLVVGYFVQNKKDRKRINNMIQRDLFEGENRRDAGISKVLNNTESWRDQFFAEADRLLSMNGYVTSLDVLEVVGCPNGNQNAIGAAMRTFSVRNGLVIRNYIKSERPSRHAARVAVWVRK